MNIVLIHPSKQHSFQTAKAIKKAGWNLKYITTVYNKESSFTSKITKLLSGNNKKKSLSRKSDFIDDKDVIQFYEKLALIRLLFSKIPILSKIDIRSFLFKIFFKKIHVASVIYLSHIGACTVQHDKPKTGQQYNNCYQTVIIIICFCFSTRPALGRCC